MLSGANGGDSSSESLGEDAPTMQHLRAAKECLEAARVSCEVLAHKREEARKALASEMVDLQKEQEQSAKDMQLALERAAARKQGLEATLAEREQRMQEVQREVQQMQDNVQQLEQQVQQETRIKEDFENRMSRRREVRDITMVDKLTLKRICEHLTPHELCEALSVCSRWEYALNRGFLWKAVLASAMSSTARVKYRKRIEANRVQRYVESAPLQIVVKLINVSPEGMERRSSVLTDLKKMTGKSEKPNKAALFKASLAQLEHRVSVARSEMEDKAAALQADISVRTALKTNLQANVDQISQCQVRKANAIWAVQNMERFKLETSGKLDELELALHNQRDFREREMGRLAAEIDSLTLQVKLVQDAREKAASVEGRREAHELQKREKERLEEAKSLLKRYKQRKRNSVREIKKLQGLIQHEKEREQLYLQKTIGEEV